jgi:hypothetical protein
VPRHGAPDIHCHRIGWPCLVFIVGMLSPLNLAYSLQLLMSLHDLGESELCTKESCHKLAWTLDACLKVGGWLAGWLAGWAGGWLAVGQVGRAPHSASTVRALPCWETVLCWEILLCCGCSLWLFISGLMPHSPPAAWAISAPAGPAAGPAAAA